MIRYLRKNTAVRIVVGPFVDIADGYTRKGSMTVTDLTMYCYREYDDGTAPTAAINGVNPTASGGNNDMVALGTTGLYDLEITASQLNWTGRARFLIYDDDVCLPYYETWHVLDASIYDAMFTSGSRIDFPVNAVAISGSYTAADNVEANIGYLDSSVATVDSVADAIRAKTDNLPADPASQSAIEALIDALPTAEENRAEMDANSTKLETILENTAILTGNQGSNQIDYEVKEADPPNNPIVGARVDMYTDSARTSLVASAITNTLGRAQFMLDAGDYYPVVSYQGARYDHAKITVS